MTEIPIPEPTTDSTRAKRSPWLAAIANLLVPPVGHLYAGALRRGLVIWALAQGGTFAVGWGIGLAPGRPVLVVLVLVALTTLGVLALDAARATRRPPATGPGAPHIGRLGYAGAVVLVLLANWIVGEIRRAWVVHPVRVPSGSMAPTVLAGDHLFVIRDRARARHPRRGDLVEFAFPRMPSQRFVKRVVGLPGESIELRDKQVWVNGAALAEPYAVHRDPTTLPPEESPRDNIAPRTIGADEVFVMGDDRDNSNDSRFQGMIPVRMLQGRAVLIYWSWDAREGGVRWDRIGLPVR